MAGWQVLPEESGLKLLAFIKNKLDPQTTARQIKRAIEAGHCQCNGKVERFASKQVGRGDRIEFDPLVEGLPKADISSADRFLYVDDYLIAYNKPAGFSSEDTQLLAAIKKQFPKAILLHRLDRDTTGVLLFARDEKSAEAILALFKQRQMHKTYFALVDGVPKSPSGTIENYLGKLHTYQGQNLWGVVSREKGQLALTDWRVEKAGKEASLLVCNPKTGRTHQIRVHLNDLGHPILGDYQYGRSFHCRFRPERLMLHAAEIAFVHPITGKPIAIAAPLPDDFKAAVGHLIEKV